MLRSLLPLHRLRRRHHHRRTFFSSSSPKPKTTKPKIPLLYTPSNPSTQTTSLQLFSWGRGASGQLAGGADMHRLYPSPSASLLLPPSSHLSSPISGRLIKNQTNFSGQQNMEAGICSSSPLSVIKNEKDFVGQEDLEAGISISTDTASSVIKNERGFLGEEEVEVGISCGLFHCALLVDGKVWMWGKGDGGRLGFGDENSVFEPMLNPNLENVKSIALGGLHSVALTSQGQVFTWGYGGFGALGHTVYTRELTPRLVEGAWKDGICHISTSGTHTAAITSSGELYTWGREEGDGRLGLGPGRGPDQAGGLSVPSKVKALPVPVSAVSCGGFFTMALTEEGQLWNWGANSNYELGRGDRIGGWKPQVVPSLKDIRIIQIATGGYHSLALTGEGKVLSWGHGGHGQLGHSSLHSQKVPTPIEALADENVTYIACGGSSCAAVTDKGKLYMWGNSQDNQLGVPGLPQLQPSPVEVNFLMDDNGLGNHNVLQIAVGASHAMCLVSRSHSIN